MKPAILFLMIWIAWMPRSALTAGPDAASVLSHGAEGCFRVAEPGVALSIPADLLPHEDFRTEWWYVTGNLTGADGDVYGFQFTLFRRGLGCGEKREESWEARHLYFAHLAVSRGSDASFYTGYRMERESFGLAGWRELPLRIWVADVSFSWSRGRIKLATRHGEPGFSLVLKPVKPPVFQGEGGYSIKDPVSRSASHYLTLPRLKTTGTLTLGGRSVEVQGFSWLDREWSTGSLGSHQEGWDWLALHLDDGRDLMVCRVRGKEGHTDYFFGSLSREDGTVRILGGDDFSMEASEPFAAPSGARYPGHWKVVLLSEGVQLRVVPLFENQEHGEGIVYWEGSVTATGSGVSGRGYLEMTGY